MIDFVLAMIAAGAGSMAGDRDETANATQTAPAQQEATATTGTPTVNTGENVTVGSGVVIGGAVAGTGTGGGASLLAGTAEQLQPVAPAETPAATPAAPADNGFNMAVVPAGLVAEDQTPLGKFTTATEVKPIMSATKGNWVAVREYNGQDLLYVTHIWGWRCGLHAMAISVNDEPMQNWPLPPCHMKYTTPNAILEDDGLPYLTLRLGSVQKIDIQLVYDDLSMESASFERGNVLIP